LQDLSNNCIQAISGLRWAQNETLFSEYYLNQKIEQELSQRHKTDILRGDVAEVGNMALLNRSQIRSLVVSLIAYLYATGFKYMVFTTTLIIANSFKRMGLTLCELADAKLESLPLALRRQWGQKYYQMSPKVYALDIQQSHTHLIPLFFQAPSFLQQLWLDGYTLGEQRFQKVAVA